MKVSRRAGLEDLTVDELQTALELDPSSEVHCLAFMAKKRTCYEILTDSWGERDRILAEICDEMTQNGPSVASDNVTMLLDELAQTLICTKKRHKVKKGKFDCNQVEHVAEILQGRLEALEEARNASRRKAQARIRYDSRVNKNGTSACKGKGRQNAVIVTEVDVGRTENEGDPDSSAIVRPGQPVSKPHAYAKPATKTPRSVGQRQWGSGGHHSASDESDAATPGTAMTDIFTPMSPASSEMSATSIRFSSSRAKAWRKQRNETPSRRLHVSEATDDETDPDADYVPENSESDGSESSSSSSSRVTDDDRPQSEAASTRNEEDLSCHSGDNEGAQSLQWHTESEAVFTEDEGGPSDHSGDNEDAQPLQWHTESEAVFTEDEGGPSDHSGDNEDAQPLQWHTESEAVFTEDEGGPSDHSGDNEDAQPLQWHTESEAVFTEDEGGPSDHSGDNEDAQPLQWHTESEAVFTEDEEDPSGYPGDNEDSQCQHRHSDKEKSSQPELIMGFSSEKYKGKKTVNDVLELIHSTIKRAPPGYVYCFSDEDVKGYLKIGFASIKAIQEEQPGVILPIRSRDARSSLWKRLAQQKNKCKFKMKLEYDMYMPCAARKMEALIHATLYDQRRETITCRTNRCKVRHKEWFNVSLDEAIRAIEAWKDFSRLRPWTANGALKTKWADYVGKKVNQNTFANMTIEAWLYGTWKEFVDEAKLSQRRIRQEKKLKANIERLEEERAQAEKSTDEKKQLVKQLQLEGAEIQLSKAMRKERRLSEQLHENKKQLAMLKKPPRRSLR